MDFTFNLTIQPGGGGRRCLAAAALRHQERASPSLLERDEAGGGAFTSKLPEGARGGVLARVAAEAHGGPCAASWPCRLRIVFRIDCVK